MSRKDLITPGETAPDFELNDVHGKPVRLSSFRGKPVVLAFLRGFM
jgi:peroxiredoxin